MYPPAGDALAREEKCGASGVFLLFNFSFFFFKKGNIRRVY